MGRKVTYQLPPWVGPQPSVSEEDRRATPVAERFVPGLGVAMFEVELQAHAVPELADMSERDRTDLVLAVGGVAGFLGKHAGSAEIAVEKFHEILGGVIEGMRQNG